MQSVQVVHCQTWPYDDPVGRLCERLGATPRHRHYSGIGGTTPQVLVSSAAEAMQRGELDLALVVGAEALATRRQAKRAGELLAWSHRETTRSAYPWEPPHPSEVDHAVFQAWETFPLWDTARRAHRHDPLDAYARSTARTMAALTEVAARNPHAWRPTALDATTVGTPTADNRFIGWPYTKREVAVMDVDMAAALLLSTVAKADELRVPEERRVHLAASSFAQDPAEVAARDDLGASASMRHTMGAALEAAGIGADDLTALDLYSCFPSSLHLACDALGIEVADPRDLTVTGGLPYAGGPASAYLLHAIAATVDRLRRDPGTALVTGVGMHLAKHGAAVYRSSPGWRASREVQAEVDAEQPRRHVHTSYAGPALVGAYTVAHDRDGAPVEGLVVLDVPDGRALARVRRPDLLDDAMARELVGHRVVVATDGTTNEARW